MKERVFRFCSPLDAPHYINCIRTKRENDTSDGHFAFIFFHRNFSRATKDKKKRRRREYLCSVCSSFTPQSHSGLCRYKSWPERIYTSMFHCKTRYWFFFHILQVSLCLRLLIVSIDQLKQQENPSALRRRGEDVIILRCAYASSFSFLLFSSVILYTDRPRSPFPLPNRLSRSHHPSLAYLSFVALTRSFHLSTRDLLIIVYDHVNHRLC